MLARHAGPLITHADDDLVGGLVQGHLDGAAFGAVLDGVVDEVHDGLLEEWGVHGSEHAARARDADGDALGLRLGLADLDGDLHDIAHVGLPVSYTHLTLPT